MTTRVYQFGCRPPTEGAHLVAEQLRAAHDYANVLTTIERARRASLRAIDDTPETRAAVDVVRAATKSTRKVAIAALRAARKVAREATKEQLEEIAALEHTLLVAARESTSCYWGSYLDIEAAHRQARSAPLYDDDALTPSDPRYRRWRDHLPNEGQIGVQLQGGLPTSDALAGTDSRCKLIMRDGPYGTLWLRVGSDGRAPVWAQVPVKVHRRVPDAAIWKWVRLSLRREGLRARWTVEITVDDPAPPARSLDRSLAGCIAVEWSWYVPFDNETNGLRVAAWHDGQGRHGEIILPVGIVRGIRKPDGIRSVRDIVQEGMRGRLQTVLRHSGDLPLWLAQARDTLHLWKSAERLYELEAKWRGERYDGAREAYEILDAWRLRDAHLYDYEAGARGEALRERRDWYRCLAARWAREYRSVLLSDQDLSREARWGPESDRRFTAGCSELRGALRNAFGLDAHDARWRDEMHGSEQEDLPPWCERAIGAWMVGGARKEAMVLERKEKTGNAWATRKAKKAAADVENGTAREAVDKCAG